MEWFATWFNSPYYHILYGHRDQTEAAFFMDNLCRHLQLSPSDKILDIACGQGRHALHLNQKGYDVVGIDLSEQSILHAKKFENESLQFFVHDIRKLFYTSYFDFAFNLFTSFGYFESEFQHVKTLSNFAKALKPNGKFVLDYFNSVKIKNNLTSKEHKSIEGLDFAIEKQIVNNQIVKTIKVKTDIEMCFEERVQAFELQDFERMFANAGLKIEETLGGYDMEGFDKNNSDRLILVCSKQ